MLHPIQFAHIAPNQLAKVAHHESMADLHAEMAGNYERVEDRDTADRHYEMSSMHWDHVPKIKQGRKSSTIKMSKTGLVERMQQ